LPAAKAETPTIALMNVAGSGTSLGGSTMFVGVVGLVEFVVFVGVVGFQGEVGLVVDVVAVTLGISEGD